MSGITVFPVPQHRVRPEGGEFCGSLPPERSALALQVSNVASWEWDIATGKVQSNAAWYALFGLPPGDYTADDFFCRVYHEDVARLQREHEACLEQDVDYATEFRIVLPDGALRWVGGRGRVIERDAGGTPIRMLGVNWDATEHRSQKDRLAALAAEMDQRVTNGYELMATLIRLGSHSALDKDGLAAMLAEQVEVMRAVHALTAEAAEQQPELHAPDIAVADVVLRVVETCAQHGGDAPDALHLDLGAVHMLPAGQASALATLLCELLITARRRPAADRGGIVLTLDKDQEGRTRLLWKERLGAPAEASPATAGSPFRDVLLQHCVALLGGSWRSEQTQEGPRVELLFPG
ncbi:PAS domain-containing protein [Parvularcula oceani]|uniref:PAS domain-containing protein n=1 Tax=Parvularcula oceani TaxID=1247963 RepID=UPI0004E16DDD|nr:PAS domain-containing protein [Parvularcula oceani]